MYNLVVFASGNGTTLQSIIDNINSGNLKAKIQLVVSNNPNAYALSRAKNDNIPTYIIKNSNNEDIDNELLEVLSHYDIDLIVLAGYLKLIGSGLINKYTIINTHPALLPKFGGKGMYGMNVHRAVINANETKSGVTLHYVNEKYDSGDIISQTVVDVLPEDSPEDLAARVQIAEKIQLIETLKKFERNDVFMKENVDVAIIMGSDSDLSVMQNAAKVLEDFGISYEMTILSVHRCPEEAAKYAKSLNDRKVKVIIAGAGGAAHLPGVFAAQVPCPVIGVPIHSKLDGVDSLYSIVQMPSGIPVATVAVDGAKNAGILAVTILSTSDDTLRNKIIDYKKSMETAVLAKNDKLQKLGYKEYLNQM